MDVSLRTVHNLIESGALVAHRIPGSRLIRLDLNAVDAWLASGERVGGFDVADLKGTP